MGLSTMKRELAPTGKTAPLGFPSKSLKHQQSVFNVIMRSSFQKCTQQTHVPLSR